jgi:hypothetical protein
LASSVNLRSGLLAVGALRPEEGNSQEPLALETTVIATGARPGNGTSKRDLFTEETQTVLVFENGAVIRLSAAVVDGQLLYLTNKATGKEVVTQVLRKRAFRPTNCYVDLQFTEPCPGFWGIEFPKSGAAPNAVSVARKLAADEEPESAPVKPTFAPSVQEVEKLKNEVAQLQTQLKSLQQPDPAGAAPGKKAASGISAELAKKEEEKQLEELFALETKQDHAGSPQRLVAYPQKSEKKTAIEHVTERWKTVAAVLFLLAAAGTAAYRLGLLDPLMKNIVASKPAAVPPRPVASAPHAAAPIPAAPAGVKTGVANSVPAAPNGAIAPAINAAAASSNTNESKSPDSKTLDASAATNTFTLPERSPDPTDSVLGAGRVVAPSASKRNKSRAVPNAASRRDIVPSGTVAGGHEATTGTSAATVPESYVAPKLLKGSKSVAPPEAIRNYVAGDVAMDALVDATGHVQTVKVLSGPAKLHGTATEVMKQYLYEPARKNGKAVPAHVQVSLQFWYSP